jgi:hypothetical protein
MVEPIDGWPRNGDCTLCGQYSDRLKVYDFEWVCEECTRRIMSNGGLPKCDFEKYQCACCKVCLLESEPEAPPVKPPRTGLTKDEIRDVHYAVAKATAEYETTEPLPNLIDWVPDRDDD